ncbi:radical SAM protein [Geobacter sp. DSM 9736]|uniref:B12-binding domain-containing radical SAM protein n=1 Tax=Geobacter sp. DSM 9736 TaxID=1277350 RepID=UPI000B50BD38|nr:Radical SAM superfamily enzyme YgiQ, UPF0313 family [Geobacter sp. DSM 9736]
MLLIFPPVAKPSEPPAGIARLAGALQAHGIPCRLLDANLEGLLWLLGQPVLDSDTWTRRAEKNRFRHLAALGDPHTCRVPSRYSRAVHDLSRLLSAASGSAVRVGLADYQHSQLSPLKSEDLIASAECPEANPFFPYFSARLTEAVEGGEAAGPSGPTVGFSLTYLSQALTTFAMIGFLKRRFPSVAIAAGGGLVTSWVRSPRWRNPFGGLIDHLVAGPGEGPLLQLLGGKVESRLHHLPKYDGLPLKSYLSPGFILPYSASSGCWWNRCSFCPERAEGNGYVPIPAEQAAAGLHRLSEQHRPVLLHLLDNALAPAFLEKLIREPPGVPWYGFARISPELAEPDYCRELRRSGCVMLKLGLESGDQGVLDTLRKGICLGTASRALANLREAGIGVYLYLLFGTPAEDEAAARRTLDFVERHREAVTFLNLALFNMPLEGEEAAEYETEPFYAGDLSLYTGFRHPGGWDRNRVRAFIEREFKRTPSVASILRNDPPVFTSNHAPFFCKSWAGPATSG